MRIVHLDIVERRRIWRSGLGAGADKPAFEDQHAGVGGRHAPQCRIGAIVARLVETGQRCRLAPRERGQDIEGECDIMGTRNSARAEMRMDTACQ